jgi:cell shape-determining protein MreD
MNKIFYRLAAVLAAIIGGMAIFAGARVLLGILPDYYLIGWLPVYNFTFGVLSVLIAAALFWRGSSYSSSAALVTLGAHSMVMLVLQSLYRDVVAPDSIQAMTVRLAAWLIILTLLFLGRREAKGPRDKIFPRPVSRNS